MASFSFSFQSITRWLFRPFAITVKIRLSSSHPTDWEPSHQRESVFVWQVTLYLGMREGEVQGSRAPHYSLEHRTKHSSPPTPEEHVRPDPEVLCSASCGKKPRPGCSSTAAFLSLPRLTHGVSPPPNVSRIHPKPCQNPVG